MLPFSHGQFVEVFARYNLAVWPSQVGAYALGAGMVAVLARPCGPWSGRFIAAGLAVMWGWTGIAYHWLQFAAINPAAWAFGALFVGQGLLFAHAAATGRLRLNADATVLAKWVGWAWIAYAAIVYPLLGAFLGPGYPAIPMFGITPCPVTLFTFGVLLLCGSGASRWLLAVPLLWSLVGGSAAFLLQVPQDWLLLASGASIFLMARARAPGVGASRALR